MSISADRETPGHQPDTDDRKTSPNGTTDFSEPVRIRHRDGRTALVYLGVTFFCLVFEAVYAHFSHGVASTYLTSLFLYPLLGGACLFGLLRLSRWRSFTRFGYDAYNLGIATLSLGSASHGVFAIAGTASVYQPVFTVAGITLVALGFLASLRRQA